LTLVRLLVVIAIIGVMLGVVLPAVQRVRGAVCRSPWLNNLKEQALSVANYVSAFSKLSSTSRPSTGAQLPWQRQTSPYLEHQGLYDQPPTGTPLPWSTPTSPYVDHQGL
jgi:type II secretory pathway pseudopilin PulG